MKLLPQNIWLLAGWFATVAVSAPADQTIVFSKPAVMPASKGNAITPIVERRAGDYRAPHAVFNNLAGDFPMPRAPIQYNNASIKEALDRRKNWTLLTPEQILGIQTPEQVLGVPDKNRDKHLSLEEKFLLRESQANTLSATNGRAGSAALLREFTENNPLNFNKDDGNNPFAGEPQKMEPGQKYFNQLLNQEKAGNGLARNNSPWQSSFAQPARTKESPEQQAEMERFRALMEPTSPPDKPEVATRFTVAKMPAANPFLQPVPPVNPIGRAAQPLDTIFSTPAGIKPLPPVHTSLPTPTTKPNPQVQLPPWLRDGPQTRNPGQNF